MLKKISLNFEKLIKRLWFKRKDEQFHKIDGDKLNFSLIPHYPNCQILDLNDYGDFRYSSPEQIYIVLFENVENVGFSLYFEEINRRTLRSLKSNKFCYQGPQIENRNLKETRGIEIILKISQTFLSGQNEEEPCRNYPVDNFESFGDCDEKFVFDDMKKKFDVTPFWATKNFSKITRKL